MLKREGLLLVLLVALGLVVCAQAMAHTPLCSCYDNGDGTVTCEGGFSDGSSASGVQMRVEGAGGVLVKGKMDEDSEFGFDKPAEAYRIVFDAGEGHVIEIDGKQIVE
jgi:hypothetical protein